MQEQTTLQKYVEMLWLLRRRQMVEKYFQITLTILAASYSIYAAVTKGGFEPLYPWAVFGFPLFYLYHGGWSEKARTFRFFSNFGILSFFIQDGLERIRSGNNIIQDNDLGVWGILYNTNTKYNIPAPPEKPHVEEEMTTNGKE